VYRDATLSSDQFEGFRKIGYVPLEDLKDGRVYQVSWANTDLVECWEMGWEQPHNVTTNALFFTAMYILEKIDSYSAYFYHPTMEHEYLVLDKNDHITEWYCKTIS